MIAFTLVYGFISLFLLITAAAIAYFLRGWKAALITSAIAFFGFVAGLFVLITLVTRNM